LTRTRPGTPCPSGTTTSRTSCSAASGWTRSTSPLIVIAPGRSSPGAAARSAVHQITAQPAAAISPPQMSARPQRLAPANPAIASASAMPPAMNATHCSRSGNQNHAPIPASSATGSQSGS